MSPFHAFLPRGAVCDLVTPFRGGTLDRIGLLTLVEWQIRSGISGLLVCGEAGEAPTLTMDERYSIVRTAVEVAERTVPVLVGCGTNCTESTIALTAQAKALGADAALLTVPYYSRPSQEGIFRHFETVAAAVDIPLIIYNAPARTAVDLSPRTIERLATIASVAALVDCTGDVSRFAQTVPDLRARLLHYCGHEPAACPFSLCGGGGAFSIAANVAPRLTSALHNALRTGNIDVAYALQERLMPLQTALEAENTVACAKDALSLVLGLSAEVRLPLTPPSLEVQKLLRSAIAGLPERAELLSRTA
ncbi:4-hydroxy-tetrahydrodipicolinate synthase [Rhizobium sp. GN54]|uniref:4-hydroxy-tetrahydrodipicolinate synthase n=1 Tax=Rhizobium sp. GN54 TaxID=2898150 RepID=UPI001E5970E2|nr:4-hydroxy-tetrahydrodipicolinate synthase [Rhizobium sp. GN54]MCD2181450.1 4-hydroxy-tetrahydrodipicolinate synthase [Rhizobium sp. GN54]